MSDGISPAEPGTAIPEEAVRAAINAAYEFVPKAGDLGEVMARAVLAAAVPLLGLAAQADTDEITYDDLLAAERQAFSEGERRAAVEAERDALRSEIATLQASYDDLADQYSTFVEGGDL